MPYGLKDTELEKLRKTFAANERIERVVLYGSRAKGNYKPFSDVDITLDTYPYPGGGMTLDALYMGVPTVTLYGERRNTRFGLSILSNLGLTELAAASLEEYVARAVGLAQDAELLDILHKNLRGMLKNSAMEPRRYVRVLEKQYRRIWQESQQ